MEPASSFLVANLCVHIFRFPCTFFALKFCFDVSVLPPRKELRWPAKSLAERTHGLGEYTLVSRNHMKKRKKKQDKAIIEALRQKSRRDLSHSKGLKI